MKRPTMMGGMPRVLLTGFCAVPGPRRAGVQLRHVIRALTPLHSVDLLVIREGDQAYVERQGSIRILRVPTPEAALDAQIQSFQRALKRQLEGADYDVVHCRDAWSGHTVLEARERLGYSVVYDLARAPLGEAPLEPELDAQYAREEDDCVAHADVVLAPTLAAVKSLAGRPTTGSPDRIVLSPPGVDVDRFDWDDAPSGGGPPRILYTGSIDPGRGVRVLIRAMSAILREVDARLVLAGPVVSAKFEAQLREGIRELGLVDKVELLGAVDHEQIPALLATATVCVVPAAADLTPNPTVVFPTKLLEYMACKRAVVAPNRETITQVVEHGREALLFEPGDPIDLARKVLRLLGEPELRDRLASNAYDRVRRELTASAARRAVRNAYDRFGKLDAVPGDDESPKVELLADDDFEATVFEEAPVVPHHDTGLNRMGDPNALEEALAGLETGQRGAVASGELDHDSSGAQASDDTLDRVPVAPAPPGDPNDTSNVWTVSSLTAPPAPANDDWVVTNVAGVMVPLVELDSGAVSQLEDGTPADGNRQPTPSAPLPVAGDNAFVAGEIDVPTPSPPTTKQEFTAASTLLGNLTPDADPDTGKRTPSIERRDRS
ncbi:MAG TPA: glycosyltransferase [Kofleriaceae bacterium]|nr:glycosyltransferase [Kofleriaceae bacterium]